MLVEMRYLPYIHWADEHYVFSFFICMQRKLVVIERKYKAETQIRFMFRKPFYAWTNDVEVFVRIIGTDSEQGTSVKWRQ